MEHEEKQTEALPITRLEFTAAERELIEEAFRPLVQTTTIIARLKGVPADKIQYVQLLSDHSGIIVPQ